MKRTIQNLPQGVKPAPYQLSTDRLSLTSAAVCVGIVAWALVNAYLSQV